jgi:hypothetical protein
LQCIVNLVFDVYKRCPILGLQPVGLFPLFLTLKFSHYWIGSPLKTIFMVSSWLANIVNPIWYAGGMLDISKFRLTQLSLCELGLGLSFSIDKLSFGGK